jgi:hypothetical protein
MWMRSFLKLCCAGMVIASNPAKGVYEHRHSPIGGHVAISSAAPVAAYDEDTVGPDCCDIATAAAAAESCVSGDGGGDDGSGWGCNVVVLLLPPPLSACSKVEA